MKALMYQEAHETPLRVLEQLIRNTPNIERLVERIHAFSPSLVYIVGRGSSDHAGVFAKYLIELELNVPVAFAAPSITSVYHKKLNLSNALVLAISQSGRSPDIVSQVVMANKAGALTIALVNDEDSPLAHEANYRLPISAGKEIAVAATKSFLCTLSAITQLVAIWAQNQSMIEALKELPQQLRGAMNSDEQLGTHVFQDVKNCVVLGRGLGYAIAREIALKLKELCCLHAESYSSAEFVHGPIAITEKNLLVLDITIKDESESHHAAQIDKLVHQGVDVAHLNQIFCDFHPRIAPLLLLQRFYLDIAVISVNLGFNPDAPQGLNKITRTQ